VFTKEKCNIDARTFSIFSMEARQTKTPDNYFKSFGLSGLSRRSGFFGEPGKYFRHRQNFRV